MKLYSPLLQTFYYNTWLIISRIQYKSNQYSTVVQYYKDAMTKTIGITGTSLVKERACRNALHRSRHLQERSRSFFNPFAV